MKSAQFWVVLLLLFVSIALIRIRGDHDRVPPSQPLADLSKSIGPWQSKDLAIAPSVLDVLGKGVFLNRVYTPSSAVARSNSAQPVGLFIGYFPTQRSGQSIHSPQNCLPGSGWSFVSSGVTPISEGPGKRYMVGEYLISNGVEREEVFYWYRTHGHNIANDYAAKARMITDSILYNRTDAALVRVMTPVASGESQADAHARALKFTELMVPMLSAYIPN
jgi:EpsI family protein